MPLVKNQTIPLAIESLASDGNGVGHFDGQAVFVPGAAPGDTLTVQITKALKTYAYGRVVRVDTPGPGRCAPDCPIAGPCGGCHFRHLTYAAECAAKAGFVRDAFRRLGGLDLPVADTLPAPCPGGYRNKVQLPVGRDQGRTSRRRVLRRAQPPHCAAAPSRLPPAARLDERPGPPGLRAAGRSRRRTL